MKTNVSFRDNPITTTIGLLLIVISILLVVLPFFIELKEDVVNEDVVGTNAVATTVVRYSKFLQAIRDVSVLHYI